MTTEKSEPAVRSGATAWCRMPLYDVILVRAGDLWVKVDKKAFEKQLKDDERGRWKIEEETRTNKFGKQIPVGKFTRLDTN